MNLPFVRDLYSRTFPEIDGQNVSFQYKFLQSGFEGLSAIYSGELELAMMSESLVAHAVGRNVDLKAIYSTMKYSEASEGCVFLRGNGTEKSPRDMLGRTFAVPYLSTSHQLLVYMCNQFGVSLDDIKIVYSTPATMKEKILRGEIHGACSWDPYFSVLKSIPGTFVVYDFYRLARWGLIPNGYVVASTAFAENPKNTAVIDHFLRIAMTVDNDLRVNGLKAPRWAPGGQFITDWSALISSEGNALKAGWGIRDPSLYMTCKMYGDQQNGYDDACETSTAVDGLISAYAFNFQANSLTRTFDEAGGVAKARSIIETSFVHNITAFLNGTTVSPYTNRNITIEYLLSFGNATSTSNKYDKTQCTDPTGVDYVPPNQTSGGVEIFCRSGANRSRTWSFKPMQGQRVVIKFLNISLRNFLDTLTVNAVNADGVSKRLLGKFSDRSWDKGWNDRRRFPREELPMILGEVNERLEVTFESDLSSWVQQEDKARFRVYSRENVGTCASSPNFCNGHGSCSNIFGLECQCFKGWFGMRCSQPYCLGTRQLEATTAWKNFSSNAALSYPTDADCRWVLTGSPGNAIEVRITYSTENVFDEIKIFASDSDPSQELRYYNFSGKKNMTDPTSGHPVAQFSVFSQRVLVEFKTDSISVAEGFNASFRSKQGASTCPNKGSVCGKDGFCSGGKCICAPGVMGYVCDLPTCSSKMNRLRNLMDKSKQSFGSHDRGQNRLYSSGMHCPWEFEALSQTAGVRLHSVGVFDVHKSDTLRVTHTFSSGKVVHVLQNSKSDYECEKLSKFAGRKVVRGIIPQYRSSTPCESKTISATEVHHFFPPRNCPTSCFVDIVPVRDSQNTGWTSILVDFTTGKSLDGEGFIFHYQYLPLKTKGAFEATPPQDVRAVALNNRIRVSWERADKYRTQTVDTLLGFSVKLGDDLDNRKSFTHEKLLNQPDQDWVEVDPASTDLKDGEMYWVSVQAIYQSYSGYQFSEKLSAVTGKMLSSRTYAAPLGQTCVSPVDKNAVKQCCGDDEVYDERCVKCPLFADCRGREATNVLSKDGRWKVTWDEPNISYRFTTCPYPSACLPAGCATGYHGAMCGSCVETYARRGQQCIACGHFSSFVALIFTISFFLLIATVVLFYRVHTKKFASVKKLTHVMHVYYESGIAGLRILKIVADFMQVSSHLSVTLKQKLSEVPTDEFTIKILPDNFTQFLSSFSFFNADLFSMLSLDCLVTGNVSPFVRMLLFGLLPFIAMSVAYAIYKISRKRIMRRYSSSGSLTLEINMKEVRTQFEYVDADRSGSIEKAEFCKIIHKYDDSISSDETYKIFSQLDVDSSGTITMDEFSSALRGGKVPIDGWRIVNQMKRSESYTIIESLAVHLLLYLHTPITSKLMSFYKCETVLSSHSAHRYFVSSDTAYRCFDATWFAWLPLNILFLVIFTLGLPLFLAFLLWKYRDRLYSRKILDRIGYFYKRKREGCAWWEIFELFRRFLLTSLLTIVPYVSMKLCIAATVSVVSLGMMNFYKPEKNVLVFWIHQISYIATLLAYVFVVTMFLSISNSEERKHVSVGDIGTWLIIVHVLVVLAAIVCIGLAMRSVVAELKKANVSRDMIEEEITFRIRRIFNGESVEENEKRARFKAEVRASFALENEKRAVFKAQVRNSFAGDEPFVPGSHKSRRSSSANRWSMVRTGDKLGSALNAARDSSLHSTEFTNPLHSSHPGRMRRGSMPGKQRRSSLGPPSRDPRRVSISTTRTNPTGKSRRSSLSSNAGLPAQSHSGSTPTNTLGAGQRRWSMVRSGVATASAVNFTQRQKQRQKQSSNTLHVPGPGRQGRRPSAATIEMKGVTRRSSLRK
jgi:hypothetical protein